MEEKNVWKRLSETDKPIIMYGMGDGAEKIMAVFGRLGIKPAAFMASDDFVRGQSFLGYQVHKLSEIQEMYGDFVIVVCFGSSLPPVMDRLYELDGQYELYAPDVPVAGEGLFDEEYLEANADKLQKVKRLLADEQSRKVLEDIISYKLTGDIKLLKECETPTDEGWSLLNIGKQETYVDLGAYNGDTVDKFLRLTNKEFEHIYAVEPDSRSFNRMVRRNYALGRGIFHPINAVAWNEDTTLQFRQSGGRSSTAMRENGSRYGRGRVVPVQAMRVDTLLEGKKATLLKLDVEGSEREALEGARETIAKYRPKLILSVYHRTEDLLELPLKIHDMHSGYRLYLRHHPYIPAWDVELYCI
ncbi:MAG: FkbM family methyltransferase [Oscillospiraceae bacterium]|nr:FkbM family methyltransferase [Oscillospiraceae bacterium]